MSRLASASRKLVAVVTVPLRGFAFVGLAVLGLVASTLVVPAVDSSASAADVADTLSAPDETTAMEAAIAEDHDVIVDSATSETTQVVAQADGTFELTVDTDPVRVQRDGAWVPVDPALAVDGTGEFLAPAATTVAVRFSLGGTNELAQVQLSDGTWLVETWPLGELPAPVVEGASATYEDVLPEVDLRLTATATGMSEVLIINTAEAAANPDIASLAIGIEGAAIATQTDGTTTVDSEGSEPGDASTSDLRSNVPHAWDSSAEGSGPDGPSPAVSGVRVPSEITDESMTLDIGSLVDDEEIEYPLYVDPDWTGGNIHAWWINQAYPNQSYLDGGAWTDGIQAAGYVQASWSSDGLAQRVRAFWQMNTAPLNGKKIIAAHFNTTEVWASSCNTRPIELWSTSGASVGGTWNNSQGVTWGTLQDSQNVAKGYNSSCPAGTVGFNALNAVTAAASSQAGSVTLGMRANNESDTYSWKKFSVGAQLVVTYNTPPVASVPVMAAPPRTCSTDPNAPSYINGTQTFTLQAVVSDSDNGNVAARFYVRKPDKGRSTWSSQDDTALPTNFVETAVQAQGSTFSTVIPANTLVQGIYRWYATGWDGVSASAKTSLCYVTVKNTAPPLPTIASVGSGPYTVGQPTTVQFSSTSADHVAVFAFWWSYSGSTSPAPSAPVLSGGVLPACDTGAGAVRYVCADATGLSPVVTVAPVATDSTLWVASYDAAGNVSQYATPVSFTGATQAAADSVNVSFDSGHGWPTVDLTSPLPGVIDDANSVSPAPLTLTPWADLSGTGAPLAGDPDQPVIDLPGFVGMSEFINSSKHVEIFDTTATGGYTFQNFVGWIIPELAPGQTGFNALYRCVQGSNDYLALSSCGSNSGSLAGYTFPTAASAPAGATVALLRNCHLVVGDNFASTSPTCDGGTADSSLGYVVTDPPSTVSGAGVDTTQSFTVSAWVKVDPHTTGRTWVALSQAGTKYYGYLLGTTTDGNSWRLCMRSQVGSNALVCANGGSVVSDQWTYLTGVWDAANQQVRLYVGASDTPVDVQWRALPVGEVSATGPTIIGATVSNYANAYGWRGQIVYPTVFPGVANRSQRDGLQLQFGPN